MTELVNRKLYQLTEAYESTINDAMRTVILRKALSQPSKDKAMLYYDVLHRNLAKIVSILADLSNLLSIISFDEMKEEWYMVRRAWARLIEVQKKLMDENERIVVKFRPVHVGPPYQMCDDCACNDCEIIRDN